MRRAYRPPSPWAEPDDQDDHVPHSPVLQRRRVDPGRLHRDRPAHRAVERAGQSGAGDHRACRADPPGAGAARWGCGGGAGRAAGGGRTQGCGLSFAFGAELSSGGAFRLGAAGLYRCLAARSGGWSRRAEPGAGDDRGRQWGGSAGAARPACRRHSGRRSGAGAGAGRSTGRGRPPADRRHAGTGGERQGAAESRAGAGAIGAVGHGPYGGIGGHGPGGCRGADARMGGLRPCQPGRYGLLPAGREAVGRYRPADHAGAERRPFGGGGAGHGSGASPAGRRGADTRRCRTGGGADRFRRAAGIRPAAAHDGRAHRAVEPVAGPAG